MKIPFVRFASTCAALVLAGAAAQSSAADAAFKPTQQQADALLWSARVLDRYRYKPETPVARRPVLDAYLEALDPDRMLFTQSDIDGFREPGALLDKDLDKPGLAQLDAAFAIYAAAQARQAAMAAHALALLRGRLDFDGSGRFQRKRGRAAAQPAAPASEAELHSLWQARLMDDILNLRIAGSSEQLIVPTLERRYGKYLERSRTATAGDAFDSYMNAFAATLDPHAAYFPPPQTRAAPDPRASTGLVLIKRDELATVIGQGGGGPAQRSGELRRGDRIVAVAEGKDAPPVEVIGWAVEEVVELLRGTAGSTVVLTVLPADARPGDRTALRQVSLIRGYGGDAATRASAHVETLDEGPQARRIGVVEIPRLYQDFAARRAGAADHASVARDVARLLQGLKADKVDAVLLDLRGNGGGSLGEVANLAATFLPDGRVSWQRNLDGKLESDAVPAGEPAWNGLLGVLIDQASAAGTEVFAGAMQDHGRALVLGDSSFGRSSVQTIIGLDRFAPSPAVHYGELKLTIAQVFRAGGSSFEGPGLVPDIPIPGMLEPSGKANRLLFPATPLKVAALAKRADPAAMVPALAALQAARTRGDARYQALLLARARLEARRARDEVSLNDAERRREAAAVTPVDLRRVQLDEAVRVMGDAVGLLRKDPALARTVLPATGAGR